MVSGLDFDNGFGVKLRSVRKINLISFHLMNVHCPFSHIKNWKFDLCTLFLKDIFINYYELVYTFVHCSFFRKCVRACVRACVCADVQALLRYIVTAVHKVYDSIGEDVTPPSAVATEL